MYLADTLSRAYLSLSLTYTQGSETQKEVESIHAVDYLAISEQQLTQVEDQVDVRSHAVRTEDGRVFRRNRRHLKKYDPPPATHTPEVEVVSSKITVTSTPPAEGAVKDSEEPPIQPPQQVSA
ncbi:unnamed protein product, partial [Porites lobata]